MNVINVFVKYPQRALFTAIVTSLYLKPYSFGFSLA